MNRHSNVFAALLVVSSLGAHAACDVSLDRVLSNNQIVLKADCGAGVTGITWYKDGASLNGNADISLGYTTASGAGTTGTLIYYTTTLTSGTHVYKATANALAIGAGNYATITAAGAPLIGKVPDQSLTLGTAYNLSLAPYVLTSNGTLTYSVAGTLPSGLSLAPATGVISGTPSAQGTSTVNWTVADSNGTATPPSVLTFTVTAGTPPTAPGTPTVTAGSGQISVAFSGGSPGSGTLTNYTANCTSSNGGTAGSASGGGSPITVGSLTNGKSYTCTVTLNSTAGSATSGASAAATPSAPVGPTAPTSVVSTAGNQQISVAFSGQNLGTGTLTNYTANCTSSGSGTAGSATGSASPIVVSSLTNNQPYTCTVTVTTSVPPAATSGASNSVSPSAGTPPTAPTSVVATAGNQQISVAFSGQNLGTGTLTNYTANCTSSGSGTAGSATGSASPIVVSSLTNSQPYTCTVTVTTSVAPAATSGASNSATPTGTSCGSSGSVAWTNFTSPGLTVAGTLSGGASSNTQSYSFVMEKGTFPGGAQILLNVSGSFNNPRDHFISSCPGDFTNPPAGNTVTNCQRLNAKVGTIYLGYTDDPATQLSYSCNLVPGQTYYLNMRTVYSSSQGTYLSSGYLLNSNGR
jgi:hypothetical protein